MKAVKCPRCERVFKVTNNTGIVECYCEYIFNVEEGERENGRENGEQ